MLNDRERRALLTIERQLEIDDPEFVARCRRLATIGRLLWLREYADPSTIGWGLFWAVSSIVLWSQQKTRDS
jgi:hypothetical protein